MPTIKAIETRYAGYRFRSRLEARWAVFFTRLGIEYRYEDQGFESWNGDYYLPDFWLPDLGLFAEVKGVLTPGDAQRLEDAVEFGGITGLNSHTRGDVDYGIDLDPPGSGLLLLGNVPDVSTTAARPRHTILRHYKGVLASTGYFAAYDFLDHRGQLGPRLFRVAADHPSITPSQSDGFVVSATGSGYLEMMLNPRPITAPHLRYRSVEDPVRLAYRAARSARFEHGETP